MSGVPRKKKSQYQKFEFSDDEIKEQIDDQLREIRQRTGVTEFEQEQLFLNLYNEKKQEKKKRKIMEEQEGKPYKKNQNNEGKRYGLEEEDEEEGQINEPKSVSQAGVPQTIQQEFSIRDLGDHIRPITLTRNKIQEFLYSPRFQQLVKGCFVRYLSESVSTNPYMIARIVGIVEGAKQYYINTLKTKYYLRVQETSEKIVTLSIQLVSNKHPPGGMQIQKWLRTNRTKMPKDSELKQKLQQHNKLLIEQLSSKEIDINIVNKAKRIAFGQQQAREDVTYLIDFLIRNLHDLQVKEQQFDKAQSTQADLEKIRSDKKETRQIIDKLKGIALEQKKIIAEKKIQQKAKQNSIKQKQREKFMFLTMKENRPDQIKAKEKARLALLSTYEGYNVVLNNIIQAHKSFQFPFE